jgi:hypothetical protein
MKGIVTMSIFIFGEQNNLFLQDDKGNCFKDGKAITKEFFNTAETLYLEE